jgi:hypothetical protein
MTYIRAGEAIADRAAHYERVRFEDIQTDPVRQLNRLAAFCGLQFSNSQMRRAAKTIQPMPADAIEELNAKSAILARYPLAAKLGYGAEGP